MILEMLRTPSKVEMVTKFKDKGFVLNCHNQNHHFQEVLLVVFVEEGDSQEEGEEVVAEDLLVDQIIVS
jgi:hypothetical protein